MRAQRWCWRRSGYRKRAGEAPMPGMLTRSWRSLLVAGTFLILVIAGAAVTAAMAVRERQQRFAAATAVTGGDPSRAPAIMRRFGCSGCHTIPGVAGADGQVGGPLSDLRRRVYVGGVAQNDPEQLVRWIVTPTHFS